jgi:hypothetical protein
MRFRSALMVEVLRARLGIAALVLCCGCRAGAPGPAADNDNDSPSTAAEWREAFDPGEAGFLSSVWGSAPDDVFVVGGQPEAGAVFHFDGTAWSRMELPPIPILVWVFGFEANDVFAVGEQGGAIRFDGASWSRIETGTDIDLWGVWGAVANDVWAVGGELANGPPVILHFDGAAWGRVALPDLDRTSTALLKVWGTSASQVFAVGQAGMILEFDGFRWRQSASGTGEDLISLWGTGPDRIIAVGGRSNGLAVVYDGTGWTPRSLAPLPGLNGVFIERPDSAKVVGLIGTAATITLDGFGIVSEDTPTPLTLHAVWGDGTGRTYAVGGRSNQTPYQGVALVRMQP